MAASIVKKAIVIDAGDSVRTVKSLKQEISNLRDQLLNLDKDTQEYEDTQKQLQQDVEDLNEVMSAHKDQSKALEGSYNDLQNQLKELKAAWRETTDEVERTDLSVKIREISDELKQMDASIGDFHRNVGNYASSWEGLNSVMDKGEKITDDLEKGIRAFGSALGLSDKQSKALSQSLNAMKTAFKLAKDASKEAAAQTTALATAEGQATKQGAALATSQNATAAAAGTMATAEGTATVATKGLSVAMGGLKAALLATGIGALVVALGALIGALDKVSQKIKNSRNEAERAALELSEKAKENVENFYETWDDEIDFNRRKQEAAGTAEIEVLQNVEAGRKQVIARLENEKKKIQETIDANEKLIKTYKKREFWLDFGLFSGGKRKLKEKENENYQEAIARTDELIKKANKDLTEAGKDIEIQKIKDAHKELKGGAEQLKKWADVVKDPKFQEGWKSIFTGTDTEGKSPTDVLKLQYEKALELAKTWKVETTEIDNFFKNAISDSEATFKSILALEEKIYDESLTPIQRLEKEKAEWIEKYTEWGQDATNLTKYYDEKIADERKKAADQVIADQEAAQQKSLKELNEYLSKVDATLAANEKLDAMFNPVKMTKSVSDEIQQDIDGVQRLYDTQMKYLNGLLESADLTEEAYSAIEQKILELTVAFQNQMGTLKAEQELQGKNIGLLSRKWINNMSLMEQATADFSSAFQAAGKEDNEVFKAFATAQALISAFLAANRVLAEEPGELAIKLVAAGAALAAGLANVYSIWSTDADGSNARSVGMSAQATPVIGSSTPINYTRNITSAEEQDELNKPIYVTVTDIEDGIDGRKAQVINSSF